MGEYEVFAPIGVGVAALVVFAMVTRAVVRKDIFPVLSRRQSTMIIVLLLFFVFIVTIFGLGAWLVAKVFSGSTPLWEEPSAEPRMTAHVAQFVDDPKKIDFVFLCVVNPSALNTQVTHVWYESDKGRLDLDNPHRPLPVSVASGEEWCTWVAADAIPSFSLQNDARHFHSRLAEGTVLMAVEDNSRPPRGKIAGG